MTSSHSWGNTGLCPDEARQLQHRDVTIIEDPDSRERILEIEVRGKRGIGWCKSMPGAVKPYERLRDRIRPVRGKDKESGEIIVKPPQPTALLFPGNYLKMFNNLLEAQNLKLDRDGKPRTAYVIPIFAFAAWKVPRTAGPPSYHESRVRKVR